MRTTTAYRPRGVTRSLTIIGGGQPQYLRTPADGARHSFAGLEVILGGGNAAVGLGVLLHYAFGNGIVTVVGSVAAYLAVANFHRALMAKPAAGTFLMRLRDYTPRVAISGLLIILAAPFVVLLVEATHAEDVFAESAPRRASDAQIEVIGGVTSDDVEVDGTAPEREEMARIDVEYAALNQRVTDQQVVVDDALAAALAENSTGNGQRRPGAGPVYDRLMGIYEAEQAALDQLTLDVQATQAVLVSRKAALREQVDGAGQEAYDEELARDITFEDRRGVVFGDAGLNPFSVLGTMDALEWALIGFALTIELGALIFCKMLPGPSNHDQIVSAVDAQTPEIAKLIATGVIDRQTTAVDATTAEDKNVAKVRKARDDADTKLKLEFIKADEQTRLLAVQADAAEANVREYGRLMDARARILGDGDSGVEDIHEPDPNPHTNPSGAATATMTPEER